MYDKLSYEQFHTNTYVGHYFFNRGEILWNKNQHNFENTIPM